MAHPRLGPDYSPDGQRIYCPGCDCKIDPSSGPLRLTANPSINSAPDPCLGLLPGVVAACCGHGGKERGYLKFSNGVVLDIKLLGVKQIAVCEGGYEPVET